MSRKTSSFTIASLALTLISGIVLTSCSSNDDDANRCCRQIGWHQGGTNGTDNTDNGIAGIMAAEDDEFSIMPVEEPIVIDDQGTEGGEGGGDGTSLKEIWQQHLNGNQGSGDEVDLLAL